jgi:uncharacterized protein (DUF1499 family)
MNAYPEPRRSRTAGWSRRFAAFSAVLLITAWLGHHFGLTETVAFLWVLAIVVVLAAMALLLAGFAFARLWSLGERGGRDIVIAVLIAALVLAPFGVIAYWAAAYPPLRDVSTDLDDLPDLAPANETGIGTNQRVAPTPGERQLQQQSYPLVAGRRYDLPFSETVDAVETVVKRQGWRLEGPLPVVADGQTEVTIHALASSVLLDLPSDIAIRVRDDDDSTFVDMRSASRYGRLDLGDNAARIVSFLTELDQEIAAQAGTVEPR